MYVSFWSATHSYSGSGNSYIQSVVNGVKSAAVSIRADTFENWPHTTYDVDETIESFGLVAYCLFSSSAVVLFDEIAVLQESATGVAISTIASGTVTTTGGAKNTAATSIFAVASQNLLMNP